MTNPIENLLLGGIGLWVFVLPAILCAFILPPAVNGIAATLDVAYHIAWWQGLIVGLIPGLNWTVGIGALVVLVLLP